MKNSLSKFFHSTVRRYIINAKKHYRDPLYRNSVANMLSQASLSFFGLLFWIIAARTMLSDAVGLAAATLAASSFVAFASRFGLDQGIVRYLPLSDNKMELNNTVTLITLLAAILFAGVFLAGLEVFSAPLLLLRQAPLLLQFLINVALTSVLTTQMYVLLALRRSDLFLVQSIMLGLRVPFLFLTAPLGLIGVLISVNVASLFPLLLGVGVLYRHKLLPRLEIHKDILREMLGFSFGNYTASIFSQFPSAVVPVLVVNSIGAAAGAYFYMTYSLAAFAWGIPTAISTSFFVEGSHDKPIKEYAIKSVKFAVLLVVPVMAFLLLFADQLLSIFGIQYSQQSAGLLRVLVAVTAFLIPISIYISVKEIQKETLMINLVYITLAILVLGCGYVALIAYGLIGIGYAWMIATIVVCIMLGRSLIVKRSKETRDIENGE